MKNINTVVLLDIKERGHAILSRKGLIMHNILTSALLSPYPLASGLIKMIRAEDYSLADLELAYRFCLSHISVLSDTSNLKFFFEQRETIERNYNFLKVRLYPEQSHAAKRMV